MFRQMHVALKLPLKLPLTETMNEEQQQAFRTMLSEMCSALRADIAKESHTQRTQLNHIESQLDMKPSSSGIQPHVFDGNPAIDVVIWLDSFSRIANINNWSKENQLNAFPLYLSGVAHAWFISLTDDIKSDLLDSLRPPFTRDLLPGPQDWLLSQQFKSTRKQAKGERIDEYIADNTRLYQQLKLSDADSVRYLTQGLLPNIQSYVTLARPKSFQEAESLARMKEAVDNSQSMTEAETILMQMEAMFKNIHDAASV